MTFRCTIAGLAVALSVTGAAHAASYIVITIDGNVSYSIEFTGQGNTVIDTLGVGYDGSTPAGASWSADDAADAPVNAVTGPVVADGRSNLLNKSPFLNSSLDGTSYFSVGPGSSSPVTLTFEEDQDSFDFIWGSIDSYNTVTFLDADGKELVTNNGAGLLNAISELDRGREPHFEKWLLINMAFVKRNLRSVRFTSELESGEEEAAFEFALPAVASIPLPAAAWFLLTGIAGLGFVGRSRRTI